MDQTAMDDAILNIQLLFDDAKSQDYSVSISLLPEESENLGVAIQNLLILVVHLVRAQLIVNPYHWVATIDPEERILGILKDLERIPQTSNVVIQADDVELFHRYLVRMTSVVLPFLMASAVAHEIVEED